MARRRPLTELEGTVLGVVRARQPCTAYQIRREFTDSPSPYWSGSAGSIYPLIARLERAGLLQARAAATGARRSRMVRLTAAGRAALVRWIGPPVPREVVGVPPDPLRTRIPFLSALSPAARQRFLDEVELGILEMLKRAQEDLASGGHGDEDFAPMARAAIAMQRARLAWVRARRARSDAVTFNRRRGRRAPPRT